MKRILLFVFLGGFTLLLHPAFGQPPDPEQLADVRNDVTSGLGVNTHFVDPKPGVLEMIEAAGLHMIRIDFSWQDTERKKGVYEFGGYDRLLKQMDAHHLRAMFILDYGNPIYPDADSPHTDAARTAFATWATAAAKHFAGRHVLWETWNEPDWQFWKPKANADEYAELAVTTARAIHAQLPNEICIGPAVSRYDTDCKFIETCMKHGCLDEWTGISVHPYRDGRPPETVLSYYDKLTATVAATAPNHPYKIIAGEWGYTNTDVPEPKQGVFAAREFMTNISRGIPITIWYDWEDDGADPHNGEFRFGLVHHGYNKDKSPVFDPKPSYIAVKACCTALSKTHFVTRHDAGHDVGNDDWILEFMSPTRHVYAMWTTAKSHQADVAITDGVYQQYAVDGSKLDAVRSTKGHSSVQLTDEPRYWIR